MSVIMKRLMSEEDLTMTSREIAELTGKRHDHIMRDIEKMFSELEENPKMGSLCKSSTYRVEGQNRDYKMYEMNSSDTLLLITGYNVKIRKAIIDRWMLLEKELKTANDYKAIYNEQRTLGCERFKAVNNAIDLHTDGVDLTNKKIAVSVKIRRKVGLALELDWNEATNEQLEQRDIILTSYLFLITSGFARNFESFMSTY